MIKEILILLWILIIPLVISFYQIVSLIYTMPISDKKTSHALSYRKKTVLYQTVKEILTPILFIFIAVGTGFGPLRGILAGEVVFCDLMTLAFYFELEKNSLKKFFVCQFVFINFLISAHWAMLGELSSTVLWISVISYPIFGLAQALPYFLKGKLK